MTRLLKTPLKINGSLFTFPVIRKIVSANLSASRLSQRLAERSKSLIFKDLVSKPKANRPLMAFCFLRETTPVALDLPCVLASL